MTPNGQHEAPLRPWPALWAICIGFFMILVDSTIVTVAMPAIMEALHADIGQVVWVTSAYLLAYAVPLLITGRLGDRVGPKKLYLLGLVVFTGSSLWCGFTGTIQGLITARVVQGLGAALMTPQTMTVITRIFPAESRGKAMGMWGSVAGVATLVGPLVGGLLVEHWGWEWIFYVNVPVGVIGFLAVTRLVPKLPTHATTFDWVGVALSAVGMFCIVFGIQEGRSYDWGTIRGPVTTWGLIGVGVSVMIVFVLWQWAHPTTALVPLQLFRERNFSLANVAMTTIGFSVTAMTFPFMLWAQMARGFSPARAAMLTIPMAVLNVALAPYVGRLVDRLHPRYIGAVGLTSFAVALVWLRAVMHPETPVWQVLLPMTLLGVANGFMWSPVSTTATRSLPLALAGAGSGVYNTVRQVGAVLGSAGIATLMEARLAAHLGESAAGSSLTESAASVHLPPAVAAGFSDAMGDSLLLPAAVVTVGLIAVLCFERPASLRREVPQGEPDERALSAS